MIIYIKSDAEVFNNDTIITCPEIATWTEEPGKKVVFRLYFAKYIPDSSKHLPITLVIGIHKVYQITT